MRSHPLICSFSYHKCASQWTKRIVRDVARRMGLRYRTVYNPAHFGGNLQKFVDDNKLDILGYNGAEMRYVKQLENFRGFHVIRDPRDILVSAYFSDLYSHGTQKYPAIGKLREELKGLSQEEGLAREIVFRRPQFERMLEWNYNQPNVLELRYEDLIKDPFNQFIHIFKFLGLLRSEPLSSREMLFTAIDMLARNTLRVGAWRLLPPRRTDVPLEALLTAVHRHRFTSRTGGRVEGQEDVRAHNRKGVAGDWKNYFTQAHLDLLNRECPELYRLGYWERPSVAIPAAVTT